jgi:hypothetical protein
VWTPGGPITVTTTPQTIFFTERGGGVSDVLTVFLYATCYRWT